MRSVLLALAAAVLMVLAFPPFGVGVLVVPALGLLLWELRHGEHQWVAGLVFGWGFFTGLIW